MTTLRRQHIVCAPAGNQLRLGWSGKTPAELVREVLTADFRFIQAWLLREVRGDADAAAEVMAAFCLRALTRAEQVKERGAVRRWLAKLLRSTLADHRRQEGRNNRFVPLDGPLADTDGPHVVPLLVAARQQDGPPCECLATVLGTMPASHAQLIGRVDLDGENRGRAAARLGLSRNALGVRLHRARGNLRDRLRALCDACLAPVSPEPCGCPLPGAGAM